MRIALSPILFIILILNGCTYFTKPSFFQNRNQEYLTAKSIPPLKIPPGLSSSAFENDYPVSNKYYSTSAKSVSLEPPSLYN